MEKTRPPLLSESPDTVERGIHFVFGALFGFPFGFFLAARGPELIHGSISVMIAVGVWTGFVFGALARQQGNGFWRSGWWHTAIALHVALLLLWLIL